MKGIERPETTFLKNQRQQLTRMLETAHFLFPEWVEGNTYKVFPRFLGQNQGRSAMDRSTYISFQISSMDSKYLIISDNTGVGNCPILGIVDIT